LLPDARTGRPTASRAPIKCPSEKALMDPKDPINQENAALDRMINGICPRLLKFLRPVTGKVKPRMRLRRPVCLVIVI